MRARKSTAPLQLLLSVQPKAVSVLTAEADGAQDKSDISDGGTATVDEVKSVAIGVAANDTGIPDSYTRHIYQSVCCKNISVNSNNCAAIDILPLYTKNNKPGIERVQACTR